MKSAKICRVGMLLVVSLLCVTLRETQASPRRSFTMRTNETVMVSSTVLPAGTYLWERVESLSNPHIVRISDSRTHRVVATIIAIAKYREAVTSKNELDFWETPTGAPRAIRDWFYPGETFGQEFPYPATLVASYRPSLIPRTELQERKSAVTPAPSRVARQESSRKVHVAEQEGSWAIITEGTPGTGAQEKSKPVAARGTIWDALSRLPLTATIAPLIGLIGLGSLVVFLLSHMKRRRRETTTVL